MNRRFLLALAASALFGLIAILIFQKILKNRVVEGSLQGQQKIVYAATKIPVGTVITQEQIKLAYQEQGSLPEGAIQNPREVVGKIAQVDLDVNLPIRANFIASEKDNRRINLSPGYRAVAIRVDEATSVAGFATPGSVVDVGAVVTPGSNSKPVSKIIVQNLRVLANGQQTQVKLEGTNRAGGTVTLEATSAQAETLMLAQREGTLFLTLRHPGDRIIESIPPVVIDHIVDDYQKNNIRSSSPTPLVMGYTPTPPPIPSPTPTASPALKIVRVISGEKVETVPVRQ